LLQLYINISVLMRDIECEVIFIRD